ncbi:hypothetical protein BCR33DRAFT_762437 [Rhizoclosmatium globosum]|uniref:Uncharacterized protein n=1 Tax=Rhizoclosmatium globosum TaxID=329046 RepID=A0A1Y2CUV2_9FUNG|nr:hypothetical protein BCR33DRAFT_762437 [Rhizoclosmatium globosum]|eukprot:ORY50840.1 hypothetical protein BCR33DRAFT_762437 [Rhizoclosmatium globosum]
MAPESAWGIANHAVRSLIAVSANSHTVTVFDMSLDAVVGDGSGSGGGDGAVLGEGVTRRELKGHGNNIPGIAFSGCGRFLGSASIDGTVRVWELRSGMCVGVVENRGVDERWWNWGVRFLEEGGVGFRRRRRREMEGSEWDRNLAVQTRKAFDVTYGSDGEETVCSFDGEEEDGYDEEDVVLCDSESEDEESKFMDSTEEPNNDNIFPMMSRQTSYFSATEDQVMESDEDEGGSNMWESDNSGTPPLVIPEELYLEDTDLDLHDEVDEADDWEDEDDVVDEFWGDDQDAEISDADDASIDSDYLWQRPVNQESSLDIKVLDQSRMAKFSGWILYTTLTSVWIVDLKTQTKICGIENVFKDVSFGRWKVFDRISIHEYVPELGIIILMTQAGAIAIIKLWKSLDSKESLSVYEMELAKVIRPWNTCHMSV